ncbi:hypothetical protein KFU94_69470 [Chloroflexi bacterium TSY]|nr:hypothetical protein [Chloroflexi bacterium TSY]
MSRGPPHYRIYLLTVWKEETASEQPDDTGAQDIWRFCLEDPRSGQRRGFPNAIALAAALQTGFAGVDPPFDPSASMEDMADE